MFRTKFAIKKVLFISLIGCTGCLPQSVEDDPLVHRRLKTKYGTSIIYPCGKRDQNGFSFWKKKITQILLMGDVRGTTGATDQGITSLPIWEMGETVEKYQKSVFYIYLHNFCFFRRSIFAEKFSV